MDELQAWAASLPPHEEIEPMDKIDTSTSLLPCPFCGGRSETWTTDAYSCDSSERVLGCKKCDIYTPFATVFDRDEPTDADAAAWNRRALVPALSAERDDLRAKLKTAMGALGDIYDGEPEWPDDDTKELMWCRERARATLAKIKGADHE